MRIAPTSCMLLAAALVPAVASHAATYHVDSSAGDDGHDGLVPERAWRSLVRVNSMQFLPGDHVLFRAGCRWEGDTLAPRGSGVEGRPIVISRYGEGARPALHGLGRVEAVVRLVNQQFWEIANLEITNLSPEPASAPRRGVEIRGRDAGWLRHIHLRNLEVHGINGPPADFSDGDVARKSFGGIMLLIDGDQTPTAWDGVLVEGCEVRDVSATGFANTSTWTRGHRTDDAASWFPSRNIVIRSNTFERIARDGVIVRAAVGPLVEHNVFRECAREANGVGCFAFHCDDAVFQFNEAAYTRFNRGDADASGFDSDWNCRRTVIQFNYSHHNDYGFLLLCCDGRSGFNEGTIVRYNVSCADGGNIVRFAGRVTGARIYNNTFIITADMSNPVEGNPPRIIFHKSWNGWAADTLFANNVFVSESAAADYVFGESSGNRFESNLFFGVHPPGEPADEHKLVVDPALAAHAPTRPDFAGVIEAFSPRPDSPLRRAGFAQPGHPVHDFAGRPIRIDDGRVDLGAIGLGDG